MPQYQCIQAPKRIHFSKTQLKLHNSNVLWIKDFPLECENLAASHYIKNYATRIAELCIFPWKLTNLNKQKAVKCDSVTIKTSNNIQFFFRLPLSLGSSVGV